jgi:hypothetical protein
MSETEYASVDDLTADEVQSGTADVTLPNGKVVKVRGLSRFELLLSGKNTDDAALIERRNVSMCMVSPAMTEKQVEAWQRRSGPVALGLVTKAIRDLSGLGEGADKSGVSEDGDGS